MAIPPFNDAGDLPPEIHRASLREVLERFGRSTAQRQAVASRLVRIHSIAGATGAVRRFIVFGSFVTEKPEPNDVDVFFVMQDSSRAIHRRRCCSTMRRLKFISGRACSG